MNVEVKEDHCKVEPYFPRTESKYLVAGDAASFPDRPVEIGPILDPAHAQQPLPTFCSHRHDVAYPGISDEGVALCPPLPTRTTGDAYLVPSLSKEERLRLTMFWYHTRQIEQDVQLLSRLDSMTRAIQSIIGWEFVIVGILDEAVYTRLATVNLPIALLPRRESTCSHTILQAQRSVFMATDMTKDWRFSNSPHVKLGGLRSYAGTQLIVTTDDGQEVALGSLCVASNSVQQPLSAKHRTLLTQFADMVSGEIVNRTRQVRWKDRAVMSSVLLRLRSQMETPDIFAIVEEAMREVYPHAHISVQRNSTGYLALQNRSGIYFVDVRSNLWEDTAFIEKIIQEENHQRLKTTQTVRVVADRCGTSDFYLVVSVADIHYVLDDTDAWFVDKCAALLAESLQKHELLQAMHAKDRFLRNITHQLRTPIHGILASVDLLSEEIGDTRNHSSADTTSAAATKGSLTSTSTSSYISAIRSSGRELMSTVNNILKLNAITTANHANRPPEAKHDLVELSHECLVESLPLVSEEQMSAVTMTIENKLGKQHRMIALEDRWLKDCIQPLLVNALQSVIGSGCGIVTMILSFDTDRQVLNFDVKDTGVGISTEDQKRVFRAFEKVDDYKAGAGLGLTLASRIANMRNGAINLITSRPGCGAHFRASFRHQWLSTLTKVSGTRQPYYSYLPCTFRCFRGTLGHSHMLNSLCDYLLTVDFTRTDDSDVGLVVTDTTTKADDLPQALAIQERPTVIIRYSTRLVEPRVQQLSSSATLLNITGPFYPHRLDSIIRQADFLYSELSSSIDHNSISIESTTLPSRPLTQTVSTAPASLSSSSQQVDTPSLYSRSRCGSIATIQPHALLVDDNLINLRILQMFCQKRGISYVVAQDGHKAIEEFRKTLPSLPSVSTELSPGSDSDKGHDDNNDTDEKGPLKDNDNIHKHNSVTKPNSSAAIDPGSDLQDSTTTSPPSPSPSTAFPPVLTTPSSSSSPPLPSQPSPPSQPINLVLMDLQMPHCNGIDATAAIRQLESRHNNVTASTIFMITGQDSAQDRLASKEAGVDEFLVKPVGLKVLSRCVEKYFGRLVGG